MTDSEAESIKFTEEELLELDNHLTIIQMHFDEVWMTVSEHSRKGEHTIGDSDVTVKDVTELVERTSDVMSAVLDECWEADIQEDDLSEYDG